MLGFEFLFIVNCFFGSAKATNRPEKKDTMQVLIKKHHFLIQPRPLKQTSTKNKTLIHQGTNFHRRLQIPHALHFICTMSCPFKIMF